MTSPLIRAATPADLTALVDLQNAASPDQPTTLELQEFRERNRKPQLAFGRLVAELGGQVRGVASFAQQEWSGETDKLWVYVTVHPEARGQGIGAALYDAIRAEMGPHRPSKLGSLVREDRPDALHFAVSRGFTEVAREQEAELEIVQLNISQREVAFARADASGYDLVNFRDYMERVGPDAAWDRLYDFDQDASRDVPLPPGDTLNMPPLERYRQNYEDNPKFDPSLWFVAVQGDTVAAVSQLWASGLPGVMDTGFTGVGRAHRGHRLAWALKYAALEEAARRGTLRVRTTNDALNAPMRSINTGLGFLPTPAYLTLSLTLKS
ncbi:GNAT family N-acetyltransferase [Deinococcus sp.]|uniref:GNAT family N-acetyltransferase n=1 Tax=Deinococcus sp. TaxID=47478 RepID=UPI003C7D2745